MVTFFLGKGKTMANFNEKIAMVAGVNAGIVAELLERILKYETENVCFEYGKQWCRCSYKTMVVYCPYLSIDQAKGAVSLLKEKGIISKGRFNDSKFDHTNWYAFTEYGERLVKAGWSQ